MAALDVEKAFDKVHHDKLFESLLVFNVDAAVVKVLRKLYRGMEAYVQLWPGVESRRFQVQRGVRQGDPLSPVLLNLVMAQILMEAETTWQRRGYGTEVGRGLGGKRLTHVSFADDVTLVARSWLSLKRMALELRRLLLLRGLRLHPTKCKAQTNSTTWTRRGSIELDEGFALQVVEESECLAVLGTSLSLTDPTKPELEHRIAVGWRNAGH